MRMILVVGLGNSGGQYALTRHNIGWWVLNSLAQQNGFPTPQAKFRGLFSKHQLNGQDVSLLWPHTMMNLSGASVQAAVAFYKLPLEHVWVLHDDLDLPPLRVKTKRGGGDAGHNGLKDITQRLGPGYHRIRIGIGHPGEKSLVSSYVLQPFALAEAEQFAQLAQNLAHTLAHTPSHTWPQAVGELILPPILPPCQPM